jgi:hypothetical protein
VVNGSDIHAATGVRITPPADFSILMDTPSSDNGEMVVLGKAGIQGYVWLIPEKQAPGQQAAAVRHDLEVKPSQRPPGWTVRPDSIRTGGFSNSQWLSAVADMTVEGHKLVEMVTWYRTTTVHAFFAAAMLAEDYPKYQQAFNDLLSTAVIP